MTRAALSLAALSGGGKKALADALVAIETRAGDAALIGLLDAAAAAPRGVVLGLTGPPGVGKSTLADALVRLWRGRGETVGIVAVDPSSLRTGGALLGDRARLSLDPEDRGVFTRSMAARDRLGGVSDQTVAAVALMNALFDHVLLETVGVGQSESDVALIADTVLLCIQPGSGDSLQFMKAGVMELPDVVVVTKADAGPAAARARADVLGALTLCEPREVGWRPPVVAVSATAGEGLAELLDALDGHHAHLRAQGALTTRRAAQREAQTAQAIRARYGAEGLKAAQGFVGLLPPQGPFAREAAIGRELARRLARD